MTTRVDEHDSHRRPAPAQADDAAETVAARLLGCPPEPIEVGAGTAILLDGELDAPGRRPTRVRVRLGECERDVDAFAMPQPRSYGQGSLWWVVLPIPAPVPLGPTPLSLLVDIGGRTRDLGLGSLSLLASAQPPAVSLPPRADAAEIAICMATYEPRREQLARQLESIRAQTREDWICLISDDCSSEAAVAAIAEEVAGDPRFALSRSPQRLGFYRNFERALRMVPEGTRLVALADQDDRWDPDKLAALSTVLAANPRAALAYSDMRIATGEGEILSQTYWYLRRNRYDDIASMLIANTVTGAASLFHRRLLDDALPFPPAQPQQQAYHDHWLALCALAGGEIAYLDRPTYDYTRHAESVTIRAQHEWLAPASGFAARARLNWRRLTRRLRMGSARPGWRAIYFDRYLLIRQLVAVLELRFGDRMAPGRRRALRLLDEAEHSPLAAAWLLARSLRSLVGRNETLARERVLFGGLVWRHAVERRSRRLARSGR